MLVQFLDLFQLIIQLFSHGKIHNKFESSDFEFFQVHQLFLEPLNKMTGKFANWKIIRIIWTILSFPIYFLKACKNSTVPKISFWSSNFAGMILISYLNVHWHIFQKSRLLGEKSAQIWTYVYIQSKIDQIHHHR